MSHPVTAEEWENLKVGDVVWWYNRYGLNNKPMEERWREVVGLTPPDSDLNLKGMVQFRYPRTLGQTRDTFCWHRLREVDGSYGQSFWFSVVEPVIGARDQVRHSLSAAESKEVECTCTSLLHGHEPGCPWYEQRKKSRR